MTTPCYMNDVGPWVVYQGAERMVEEVLKMTGDVDKDFAILMIPHHQGAIDMAKIELEHGKNEELKKMAQAIIDSQAKEIEVLKKHAGQ